MLHVHGRVVDELDRGRLTEIKDQTTKIKNQQSNYTTLTSPSQLSSERPAGNTGSYTASGSQVKLQTTRIKLQTTQIRLQLTLLQSLLGGLEQHGGARVGKGADGDAGQSHLAELKDQGDQPTNYKDQRSNSNDHLLESH